MEVDGDEMEEAAADAAADVQLEDDGAKLTYSLGHFPLRNLEADDGEIEHDDDDDGSSWVVDLFARLMESKFFQSHFELNHS